MDNAAVNKALSIGTANLLMLTIEDARAASPLLFSFRLSRQHYLSEVESAEVSRLQSQTQS